MVRQTTETPEEIEEDMTERMYQILHGTNYARDAIDKFTDVDIDIMARGLSDGGMAGEIGEYVRRLTGGCPVFTKMVRAMLYKAAMRCLQEYKLQKGAEGTECQK